MSEMIDRVAGAIAAALIAADNKSYAFIGNTDDLANVLMDGHFDLLDLARAAIEAMRASNDDLIACWDSMINSALKD